MLSHLFQSTHSGLAYMVIGGFAVGFTMVALLVKQKLYINEVVLGTAVGVVFGPLGANLFNPRAWGGDVNAVTLEVTRIALAAGLFTIGVELPNAFLARHARGLLVMVVPTMAIGWVVVAAVIFLLFPQLDIVSALVIAACLTPTDPIISASIIGGKFATKRVPQNLRWIIAAESAANDGLAYPFLSLSIFLTLEPTVGAAFTKWILIGCLYQVALGTLIGAGIGLGFSRLMKLSQSRGFIDSESYVAQYLALTLFTIGVARTVGSDDLLAAFAAGSALNWDGHFDLHTHAEGRLFSAVIDLVLNCGTFVYIGAWMPFAAFSTPALGVTPWRLVLLLVAVLALRRIPALLVLYRWVPEIKNWREALFAGHFGPMGVGAVFVSTFALTELPKPHTPPQNQAETLAAVIQAIVAFVVLGSIVVHGLSIALFSFGARTRTLTRTWTSRTRSRNGAAHTQPEWLLSVRRHSPADMHGARETASDSISESGDGKDSRLAPDVEASAAVGRVAVHDQDLAAPATIVVLPPAPAPTVIADAARAHLRGAASVVDRALVTSRHVAHNARAPVVPGARRELSSQPDQKPAAIQAGARAPEATATGSKARGVASSGTEAAVAAGRLPANPLVSTSETQREFAASASTSSDSAAAAAAAAGASAAENMPVEREDLAAFLAELRRSAGSPLPCPSLSREDGEEEGEEDKDDAWRADRTEPPASEDEVEGKLGDVEARRGGGTPVHRPLHGTPSRCIGQ